MSYSNGFRSTIIEEIKRMLLAGAKKRRIKRINNLPVTVKQVFIKP